MAFLAEFLEIVEFSINNRKVYLWNSENSWLLLGHFWTHVIDLTSNKTDLEYHAAETSGLLVRTACMTLLGKHLLSGYHYQFHLLEPQWFLSTFQFFWHNFSPCLWLFIFFSHIAIQWEQPGKRESKYLSWKMQDTGNYSHYCIY